MIHRQHNRGARNWLVIGVVGALAGCAKSNAPQPQIAPTAAQVEAPTFTFAPPAGTHYVRTETHSSEASIAGAPLRELREDTFRWVVDIQPSPDGGYVAHQDLARITYRTNGTLVAEATTSPGTIAIDLVIDRNGNLSEIRGLERASDLLTNLAPAGAHAMAADAFSPDSLRSIVFNRYQGLIGNFVGRPSQVGASWTLPGGASPMILSRTVTVEGTELCGAALCDRIRVDADVDTQAVKQAANALVKQVVASSGGNPVKVEVQRATKNIVAVLVVEPSTLLAHGALLDEQARVTVAGPNRTFDFALHGRTKLEFDYRPATTPLAMTNGAAR